MKIYAELIGNYKKQGIKSPCDNTPKKETFEKIQEIVLRKGRTSESIASLKDIVEKETEKSATNKDGFKHDPASYSVGFYNGSSIYTLNSKPDNIRGKYLIYEI